MYKISGNQIFWMIATMEIGMSMLLTITPAIAEAKHNAWISTSISMGIGIFIAFIAVKLSLLYPDQTLIEYSQTILGKWLGKIIVIPFFISWYSAIAIILRQSAEVIVEFILPETPLIVVILFMGIAVVYATSSGIEVIGRLSEMLGPIILLIIISSFILVYGETQWENILPIAPDAGWLSILKGAIPSTSFLGECTMVTMLLSFMSKPKEGPSRTMWAVGISGLLITVSTVFVLATLGPHSSSIMWYPFFTMVQMISIADFLTNVDALVIVIWIGSVFIKLSLYFFITSYGTAQWLHVQKTERMIWFVFPLVLLLALVPRNILEASIIFPKKFVFPFVLPIDYFVIPLLLLIVGSIRKKMERPNP